MSNKVTVFVKIDEQQSNIDEEWCFVVITIFDDSSRT